MKIEVTKNPVVAGATVGSVLAMIISFNINNSIFWALVHGLFSWLYVIYYVVFLGGNFF